MEMVLYLPWDMHDVIAGFLDPVSVYVLAMSCKRHGEKYMARVEQLPAKHKWQWIGEQRSWENIMTLFDVPKRYVDINVCRNYDKMAWILEGAVRARRWPVILFVASMLDTIHGVGSYQNGDGSRPMEKLSTKYLSLQEMNDHPDSAVKRFPFATLARYARIDLWNYCWKIPMREYNITEIDWQLVIRQFVCSKRRVDWPLFAKTQPSLLAYCKSSHPGFKFGPFSRDWRIRHMSNLLELLRLLPPFSRNCVFSNNFVMPIGQSMISDLIWKEPESIKILYQEFRYIAPLKWPSESEPLLDLSDPRIQEVVAYASVTGIQLLPPVPKPMVARYKKEVVSYSTERLMATLEWLRKPIGCGPDIDFLELFLDEQDVLLWS